MHKCTSFQLATKSAFKACSVTSHLTLLCVPVNNHFSFSWACHGLWSLLNVWNKTISLYSSCCFAWLGLGITAHTKIIDWLKTNSKIITWQINSKTELFTHVEMACEEYSTLWTNKKKKLSKFVVGQLSSNYYHSWQLTRTLCDFSNTAWSLGCNRAQRSTVGPFSTVKYTFELMVKQIV